MYAGTRTPTYAKVVRRTRGDKQSIRIAAPLKASALDRK